MKKLIGSLFMVSVMLQACKNSSNKDHSAPKDILVTDIDSTTIPGDDFFQYANGGWLKRNTIPDDETSWGIGYLVEEELYKRKKTINEDALKSNDVTSQLIANFWQSGMDTVNIDKQGIKPLQSELDSISNLRTTQQVVSYAAKLQRIGVDVLYSPAVYQDQKHSDEMGLYVNQGGLGLPNRDYYFNTDKRTSHIRSVYPTYIAKTFINMGIDSVQAKVKAANIVSFETKLAAKSRKLEALRDPYKNYNKFAINDFDKKYPNEEWKNSLHTIGVHSVDSIIVGQPEFLSELNSLLKSTPVETLKDYLTFHLISTYSKYLSQPFQNIYFDFYSKEIRGAKAMKPRWKRVLDVEESTIGEAVGQLFVKEYFNENA
ncbi:MAG: M13 family peptidase, partial [Pseudopedobacter saltans]